MRLIRWVEVCPEAEALHVAYVTRSVAGSWETHGHDFFEIFWVDSGRGWQVFSELGGRVSTLESGRIGFIRPGDVHALHAEAGTEPFTIINVAFSRKAWAALTARYGIEEKELFHVESVVPPVQEVAEAMRREVGQLFRELLEAPRTEMVRDWFLLSLVRRLGGDLAMPGLERAPAWLRKAMLPLARDAEGLRGGPAELARRAGCSPAHLTRTMRATLGRTPSEWILGEKLRRAAGLLASTGFSVAEVALQAGFDNLSHFHRCFAKGFGMTPRRYRMERSQAVV